MDIMDSSEHFGEPMTKAVDLEIRKKKMAFLYWALTMYQALH